MTVLFWDFDGTLVHSEHLWSGSMYKALLTVVPDTAMTFEDVRFCNLEGYPWQTPERDQRHMVGEAWWDRMYQHFYKSYRRFGVPDRQAAQAASLVRGIIKEHDNYQLYPDAIPTVSAFRERGYRNVLLSNNYPDMEELFSHLGLSALLDGVVLSGIEGYDKPRPELFQIAKERFPADRYVMIGDNEYADIQGGSSAGMTTVYVHKGFSPLADHCVDRLSDLLGIL